MARTKPSTTSKPTTKPDTAPDTEATTEPDATDPKPSTKPSDPDGVERFDTAYDAAIASARANDGQPSAEAVEAVTSAYGAVTSSKRAATADRASKRTSTAAIADPTKPDTAALVAVGLLDGAIRAARSDRATDSGPTLADVIGPRALVLADTLRTLVAASDAIGPDALASSIADALGADDAVEPHGDTGTERAADIVDVLRSLVDATPDTEAVPTWNAARLGGKPVDVTSEPTTKRTPVDRKPLSTLDGEALTFAYGDATATVDGGHIVTADGSRFDNPSAAAVHVGDGSAYNGYTAWKRASDGVTLHNALKR